jgi:lipopolysaccharide export system permease protein
MVIALYLFIDFIEKSGNFVQAGLPMSTTVTYFIYNIPFIVSQITPVGILLAVLVVFGLMNKKNEIVALRSCGVSVYYLLKPVLVIGLVLAVGLFYVTDILVPTATWKANRIWQGQVKKKKLVSTKKNNIWLKDRQRIIHVRYFRPQKNTVAGITLNYFDNDFRMVRRIDADKGRWQDGNWHLISLMEQVLDPEIGEYKVIFHEEQKVDLGFVPDDLKRGVKKSEEMNFKELWNYIERVEAEGYNATNYRVDLYAKPALPFVCLIMCLVGLGISVRRQLKDGVAIGVAFGLGIAFLYWISFSFCVSLGYGEMLPPFLAAWITNIIFLCLGVLLILNAE